MGYLTKLVRRILLHLLSYLTCNANLAPTQKVANKSSTSVVRSENDDEEHDNDNDTPEERDHHLRPTQPARYLLQQFTAQSFSIDPETTPNNVITILYISAFFDLIDWMNVLLDLIFIARLYGSMDSNPRENDGALYASLLLVGLIVGRLVSLRGDMLLFRYGLDWNPHWIVPHSPPSIKNQQAFQSLYCLLFAEASLFFFEDYPSLVVYEHWMTVAFPPPVLETLDNVNVAMSAFALGLLMLLFLVASGLSLYLLLRHEWNEWSLGYKSLNVVKIVAYWAGVVFLLKTVIDMLEGAIAIVFRNERRLPNNTILGIEICDDTSFPDRYEMCHERIFVVRVATAWFAATIFALYLLLSPAKAPPMDGNDEQSADAAGGNNNDNAEDLQGAEDHVSSSLMAPVNTKVSTSAHATEASWVGAQTPYDEGVEDV